MTQRVTGLVWRLERPSYRLCMRSQALHIGVKARRYSPTFGIEAPPLKPLSPKRHRGPTPGTGDKVGKGIDVALVTLAFLGIGYALDRWLGTKPLFMIGFVVLGARSVNSCGFGMTTMPG